jgi:sugar phosphate isomerase/epimerase
MHPISLSTAWNGTRHDRASDALSEIRSLGFEWVELYAHWLPTQLRQIEEALPEHGLKVSSLHGPCPVPADEAGERLACGDWLAEVDDRRRRMAVDAHRRTIDVAAELGARGVVVHLGNSGAKSLQKEIFDAVRARGFGSVEHQELVLRAREERRRIAGNGALDAATRSAYELGQHAQGTGVRLGLECRDGYVEIPALDEYPAIFDACKDLPVHYWHDVGHGSKLENAGLLEAEDYLRRFGDRLLGVHLHDTTLDRDHQAPGQGETDFAMIRPYLRPDTIRTMELAPRVESSHIRPGVAYLQEAGLL